MLTILFLLLIVFFWISTIVYAKQKAKILLKKYSESLPWVESNNTFKMIIKLQSIKRQKKLKEEDVFVYRISCIVLISSLLIIPILMLLAVVLKITIPS
jgi:hypothetical protein